DDMCASKIGEVPRNLWLTGLQNRHEEADTHFRITQQTDQSQTRSVGQRFDKICDVVAFLRHVIQLQLCGSVARAKSYRARRRAIFQFAPAFPLRENRRLYATRDCRCSLEIFPPAKSRSHSSPIHL